MGAIARPVDPNNPGRFQTALWSAESANPQSPAPSSGGTPGRSPSSGRRQENASGSHLHDELMEGLKSMEEGGRGNDSNDGSLGSQLRGYTRSDTSSWLKPWFDQMKHLAEAVCLKILEEGGIPQARDSPLKHFGYVYFDVNTKTYSTSSGVPLSVVNGALVPIKLGSRDYIMQGKLTDILLFLKCYSKYQVVGSYLGDDGHWDSTPDDRFPVYVQVENVGPEAHGSVSKALVRHSMQRVLKRINPRNVLAMALAGAIPTLISNENAENLLTKLVKNWSASQSLGELSLNLKQSAEDTKESWEKLASEEKFVKRMGLFLEMLLTSGANETEEWQGKDNVDLKKDLTVVLTMYPRPENKVRATRKLSSSTVSVEEVLVVVSEMSSRSMIES
ncbi:hypothetical protein cyc_08492 [Cyclospora cayetanensis]|uniref:Uncharacterized protein n=1 Tax=Cyclospora cayetanensis TaxID=88456 RepID=A0A1D3D2T3_9EIME|nr:hypothetical protein cyc_08492 [Cyclospora cayetanensis]